MFIGEQLLKGSILMYCLVYSWNSSYFHYFIVWVSVAWCIFNLAIIVKLLIRATLTSGLALIRGNMVVEIMTEISKMQDNSWGITENTIKYLRWLWKTYEIFFVFINALLIINIFTTFYEYFNYNEEVKTICIALECPSLIYFEDILQNNSY